jgi:hypothetical protein
MSSINPARYKFSNSRYIHPEYLSVEGCGCENCTENPCQQNFMASFDRDGNILIPAGWIDEQVPFTSCSGYFNNWENEIPPSSVHQIPCYYKVTINGTENNNVNESWCQQCEGLDNEYYAIRYNCLTDNSDTLIKIPLCNDNNIISYCGLNELEIRLFVNFEIPEQQGHPYGPFLESKVREEDLSKIAPYHNEACYVYRYSQLEEENREKLYIYAVANLKYDDNYEQDPFQPFVKPCNCLKYGYFFVTRIGEFKGDYSVLSDPNGTIYSINTFNSLSYGNCIRKYYHGDFDGRNLTFTILKQMRT